MLGGLLLDNDAVDRVGDVIADADFYSDAHRLIYRHIVALAPTASRPTWSRCPRRWPRRRSSTTSAGSRISARWSAERADRRQHPALRADRPRSLDPAPARRDRRRHRRHRLQPAGPQREGGARPGRGESAAHRRAGRARRAAVRADRHAAGRRRRPHRDAVQPRRSVRRHRRADRLRRSRPDDLGTPARRSRRRRRPAEHGKDGARAQHRRARRARRRTAGRRVLDGNGRVAARAAPDRLGGPPRPAQAAHGPPRGRGLGEAHGRARPAQRGADPDRRDAGAERDRGPLARAPAHEELRQARPRHRRLPAAHAGDDHGREPRDRDLRDLARDEVACEGAQGAGDGAVAAQPLARAAAEQAAGDVGPARDRARSSRTPT